MEAEFEKTIRLLQLAWKRKTPQQKAAFRLQIWYECVECGEMLPKSRLRWNMCYPCHFHYKYS